MSAYICHDDTINLIACAAARCDRGARPFYIPPSAVRQPVSADGVAMGAILSTFDVEDVAKLLHAENVYSVNARYRSHDDPPFTFRSVDLDGLCGDVRQTWPVIALGSIRCLRYQSCEADDYDQSAAKLVLDSIEAMIIDKLTRSADVPWGWTRAWSQERREAARARINIQMAH